MLLYNFIFWSRPKDLNVKHTLTGPFEKWFNLLPFQLIPKYRDSASGNLKMAATMTRLFQVRWMCYYKKSWGLLLLIYSNTGNATGHRPGGSNVRRSHVTSSQLSSASCQSLSLSLQAAVLRMQLRAVGSSFFWALSSSSKMLPQNSRYLWTKVTTVTLLVYNMQHCKSAVSLKVTLVHVTDMSHSQMLWAAFRSLHTLRDLAYQAGHVIETWKTELLQHF